MGIGSLQTSGIETPGSELGFGTAGAVVESPTADRAWLLTTLDSGELGKIQENL